MLLVDSPVLDGFGSRFGEFVTTELGSLPGQWHPDGVASMQPAGVHAGTLIRTCAVVLGLGIFLAACSSQRGGSESETTSPSTSSGVALEDVAVLDCRDSIASDAALPDGYEEIAGVIALPARKSSPTALQTSARRGSLRLCAKTGLLLKPGIEFTITATGRWSGRATAWWGNTGRSVLARSFLGGPCQGSGWRAYPGGFFVGWRPRSGVTAD